MTARTLLDRVQSLAAADALAAKPGAYAAALELPAATTLAELAARDAELVAALYAIDEVTSRVMRIGLDHALVADTSLAPPTRKVFAATIVNYEHTLDVLATRARDLAARGGAPEPDAVGALVVAAARRALDVRAAIREPVLARVRELATAAIPDADRRARDRDLADAQRLQWSAVRRDLETIVGDPACILAAPMAARLAAWPAQLDEPAPKPEPTLAELIEID
jgi:hypothetical protein